MRNHCLHRWHWVIVKNPDWLFNSWHNYSTSLKAATILLPEWFLLLVLYFISSLIHLSTGGQLNLCKFFFTPTGWQFESLFWSLLSWQTTSIPSLSFFCAWNNLQSLCDDTNAISLRGWSHRVFVHFTPPQERKCHFFDVKIIKVLQNMKT